VIDAGEFAECGFQAYPGLRPDAAGKNDRNSYALYLDIETQITDSWLVGTALRYEDFSDAGDDLVGKLSTRYEVNEDFALRGAIATGFRAPSLQQSAYTAFTTNLNSAGDLEQSFTANAGSPFPAALGVDSLKLETSESISFGAVLDVTSEMTLTIDAYHIKIEDRINLASFLKEADLNTYLAADDAIVAIDALNATGAVQANYFSNSVNSTTKGVDIILTYKTELNEGDFGATLAANINETKIDSVNAPEGIPENIALDDLQRSFLTNGQPQERATFTIDYAKNAWSTLVRANYFGETDVDYFANNHIDIDSSFFKPTSTVESAVLIDVNVNYQINDNLNVSFTVNNVFDVTPDELGKDEVLDAITNGAFKYPVRALPYGFDGTTYSAKLNFSF
jgi:iron complex outermembrane receptor protein